MKDDTQYLPTIDSCYYPYGNFNLVKTIIDSKQFFPIWITGLSGNGKTHMIQQACALSGISEEYFADSVKVTQKQKLAEAHEGKGREFIRINFNVDTDEIDLIGGITLKDGNTVYEDGPVVEALRRGAVLLLDEIDCSRAGSAISLQSVLEGKGVFIKSKKEWVHPAPGFQVFATSNTKGKGSEDGTFIGTNVMNGAFLDRFAGTIEQAYPTPAIEEAILKRYFIEYLWKDAAQDDKDFDDASAFIENLCRWAKDSRDNYDNGAADEVITTRALINIIKGYSIFKDKKRAVLLACSRFDAATRDAMIEHYQLLTDDKAFSDYPDVSNSDAKLTI